MCYSAAMDETTTPCPTPTHAFNFEEFLDPAIFRALGDTTRLALLGRLAMAREALTVTEVADCCGVHLSGVSRHLKMLHGVGLVEAERQGREVRYRLRCAALSSTLRQVADALDGCVAAGCCTTEGGTRELQPDHRSTRKEFQHDGNNQGNNQ